MKNQFQGPLFSKESMLFLLSDWSLVYMEFLQSVGLLLNEFLVCFQAEKPLIHALYQSLQELLSKLCCWFLKPEVVESSRSNFKVLRCEERDNQKNLSHIEVGESCLNKMKQKFPDVSNHKRFLLEARSFYVAVVSYLIKKLPMDSDILQDLQIFHPSVNCLPKNPKLRYPKI